ncbi:MAG: heavy-metal-associated domain-containing protein [Anaerolinea sp.]|nr:heavy-metal-associated domain-containing protein [Anaerolinea sp.]
MQQSKTFQVPSMTDADVEVIENALQQVAGVESVQVFEPTQTVVVVWHEPPAQWDDFDKRLRENGFTPDLPHPETRD